MDPIVGVSRFRGHVDGKVGVAYYNQLKAETSSVYLEDEAQHWSVTCGQNKKGGVQLVNGMERSLDARTVLSGGQGDEQLAVNGQGALQVCDVYYYMRWRQATGLCMALPSGTDT